MAKKVAKKKATKKAASKKKTTTASRPSWKVNAAATRKVTTRIGKWLKWVAGNTVFIILPPLDGTGVIYPPAANHYGLKDPNDDGKEIAPACLNVHGGGNCYICNFIEWLDAHKGDDPLYQDVGKRLWATATPHAQVLVKDMATKEWVGPQIAPLKGAMIDCLNPLLSLAEDNGTPYFCDPERAQEFVVHRAGTGQYDTKYTCQPTGNYYDLDKEIPDWYDRAWKDLTSKFDLRMMTIDEQKERLYATFPDFPWEDIEASIG